MSKSNQTIETGKLLIHEENHATFAQGEKTYGTIFTQFWFIPSDGWSNNRKVENFGCCCFFSQLTTHQETQQTESKVIWCVFLFICLFFLFCLCFCSSSLKPHTSYTFLLSCFHSWFPLKPWHVIISTKLPLSLFGASKHLSSLNWISFTFVKVKNCKWRGRPS